MRFVWGLTAILRGKRRRRSSTTAVAFDHQRARGVQDVAPQVGAGVSEIVRSWTLRRGLCVVVVLQFAGGAVDGAGGVFSIAAPGISEDVAARR